MDNTKRFIGLKTKIMLYILIPVVISFTLMSSVFFVSLFNSRRETARANLTQICEKYAASFEAQINNAVNYLAIAASALEFQVETHTEDREMLQELMYNIFDDYGLIDGSSVYFEPDMYDGRDSEYIGTEFGTVKSGRICWYFYVDGGETAYLPEAVENEIEFEMSHYTDAKESNKPIYTAPFVTEVDGKNIPMFTLTYPVRDNSGQFIGAVTVDLFLEDIYAQLQNEKIYESGYAIIANDKGEVIYSPRFEDIGKTREEAGLAYALPSKDETSVFLSAKSILSGKNTLLAIESIYIPQLDSYFYVSAAAPIDEINADSAWLVTILVIFSVIVIAAIALLLYYLMGRILTPIKAITGSANKIANGDMDEASAFVVGKNDVKTIDEVYILHESLRKMLMQISEMQALRLESLMLKYEKDKAEESSRVKTAFLANMSHEIRTPMNAIIGMTELLLNEPLNDRQQSYVSDINVSSHALLAIINDILDLSKIETGKMELNPVDYDFRVFIDNIRSMFMFVAQKKGLDFKYEEDGEMPLCAYGDDIRLRQVLTNICGNAVKFTSQGFIRLRVTADDETLAFEIKDTGMGIREEDLPKLFDAFSQADTRKNRNVVGTGLGLAISKSFVEMMGGDISVESEYGIGTAFTVTIPMIPGDESAIRHNDAEKAKFFSAPAAKILVVDDNEVNLKVARGLLNLFKIDAVTALSGREAIEAVRETDYDIVFMDHMMPEMDGIETTGEIRKMGGKYEHLTIVALTANAIHGAKEMFMSHGMDGFISKPIDINELAEILREYLPLAKIEKQAADEPADSAEGNSSFLDAVKKISGVNTEVGLSRVSGLENMYRETVELFYKKLPAETEKMSGFLNVKDLRNLGISVHAMKSSLSTIGAMELSGTAAKLEEASKSADMDYCGEHFPGFLEELRVLHEELAAVFPDSKEPVQAKPEGDTKFLRESVQKALAAAEDFDMDAGIDALSKSLEYDFGEQVNELLENAKAALMEFEFDAAAEFLNKLNNTD